MKIIQARHAVDLQWASDMFRGETAKIDRFLSAARSQSRVLSTFTGIAEFVYTFGGIVAPDSTDSARGLVLAAQANTAVLVFARIDDPPCHVTLGAGPPVTFAEPVTLGCANATVWLNGCRQAMVTRQPRLLDLLTSVTTDFLRTTTSAPDTTFCSVDVLRAVVSTPAPTQSDAFRWQADYYAGCLSKSDHHRAVRHVGVPYLEVIRGLESGEETSFESALMEACRLHGKYYGATEKSRKDSNGFVSLELTALAALAYDRGMKFNIDLSEYVPAAWVRGDIFRQVLSSAQTAK